MNFVISALVLSSILFISSTALAVSIEELVRASAIENGMKRSKTANPPHDPDLAKLGELFFGSKAMSLNGGMSCQTCHLDKFGSADGIPNGIGVGGEGEGSERVLKGGDVVPRNTLALWGRGIPEFRTFFWDGKIDFSKGRHISQFGAEAPSRDPLEIAIHLPVVEIREMLAEDNFVQGVKKENVRSADEVYFEIISRLSQKHPEEMTQLAKLQNKDLRETTFDDVAIAIKNFFKSKFALQKHRFESFVFDNGKLSQDELRGGLLFYGKGKCSVCHSGVLFSDLEFHGVPMGQLGSGKNGFGVDYGRFNVTHNTDDLYKFRTPPLLDVENTAPYGHSGSVATMRAAVVRHFDPLRDLPLDQMTDHQRVETYKQIAVSAPSVSLLPYLDQDEVGHIVEFMKTLSFRSKN